MPRHLVTVAALAVAVAATAASCGGSAPKPLTITGVARPTGPDRAACLRLAQALPSSLGDGLDRRTLATPTPFAAAWGRRPVVLTCGVAGVEADYRPDAMLTEVDGVGWFEQDLADGARFSTPTRKPQVVVIVPGTVSAADVLTSLARSVAGATRPTTS